MHRSVSRSPMVDSDRYAHFAVPSSAMRTKNFTCPPMNSTRDEPCVMQSPNLGSSRLNVSSTFPSSSEPSCPEMVSRCFGFGRSAAFGASCVVGAAGGGSEPPHATPSETTMIAANRFPFMLTV
jgi:hypothetical protein